MSTAVKTRFNVVKRERDGSSSLVDRIHRFSLNEYHNLVREGFFKTEQNIELLNGWIVHNMPANPSHKNCMRRVTELLPPLIPKTMLIDFQGPVTIGDSEPEPDVSITFGPQSKYKDRLAGPKDLALVMEISDSTLDTDQFEKNEIYASADIPYYWIVNLQDFIIEVYSDPEHGKLPSYTTRKVYRIDSMIPLILNGKTVGKLAVGDFFS